MKKFSLLTLVFFAAAMLTWTGCTKETIETDKAGGAIVQQNDIPNGTKTITYSISVISANNVQQGKLQGLQGARVTLVRNGQSAQSAPSNASGVVVFTGLGPGTISGFVEAPNCIGMNFTAVLTTSGEQSNQDQVEFAGTTIVLFERNASVNGRARGDWDLNPITPTTYNAQIAPSLGPAIPPVPVPQFKLDFTFNQQTYLTALNGPTNPTVAPRSGQLITVVLDHSSYITGFSDPQTGRYQFGQVPSISTTYGLTTASISFPPLSVAFTQSGSPTTRTLSATNAAAISASINANTLTPGSTLGLNDLTIQ